MEKIFEKPPSPLPNYPYIFIPADVPQANHDKMALRLSQLTLQSPSGAYDVHAVVNNGKGYSYYARGKLVAVIRKSDCVPLTAIKDIMKDVKESGPRAVLAHVSNLCVGRGKTLQDAELPFTGGIICSKLFEILQKKRGNGGTKHPYMDKVWRELYQIVGRIFFSIEEGGEEPASLPWIACDDNSDTIHHNMLVREGMAVQIGGLGEEKFDVIDEKKVDEIRRKCMQRVLINKNRSATDQVTFFISFKILSDKY